MSDILKRLATLSPEKRDLLLKQLQAKGARTPQTPAIPPLEPRPRGGAALPLSFAQQRLWFLEQLEPGTARYNVPTAVRLRGPLDAAVLERVFNELLHRHEPLRTTFRLEADTPVQVIAPTAVLGLAVVDLTLLPAARREEEARRLATAEAERPFDLERGPLLRTTLLKLDAQEHVLLLTMHHIVSDGWSMGVLVREVGMLYAAFSASQPSPLPELSVQYADYAVWQREWLQGKELERHLSFWKEQLEGAAPALELPTDRPRPREQTFHGESLLVPLSRELSESLKALCQREGVTPFMLLLSAFQVVLQRYSGQESFCIGTPLAGRDQAQLEGLIGIFINTLALRTRMEGNPTFRELLQRVKESSVQAFAHQHLPFEKLVEALQPERDLGRSPLFQVLFAFQNAPTSGVGASGLSLSAFDLDSHVTRFDLELSFGETPDGLNGRFTYNTDLFDAATLSRMAGHLRVLLERVVASPESRIAELSLLSASERHQVLVEWNDTAAAFPADACIHHLFEQQVALRPDAIAVEFGDARLSYRELDARANQLAHLLRSHGVGPDTLVALCLERSLELIVSLLAILKAGGAYLPLDASYPAQRLAFMLEDAPPRLLLTSRALRSQLAVPEHLSTLLVEELGLEGLPTSAPASGVSSRNLAYVDFTSGTTGRPKGVAVEHRSVLRLFHGIHYAHLGPEETFLLIAPVSFDASTLELWGPLLFGGRLVVFPPQSPSDLELLAQVLTRHRVTTLHLTAGLFSQVVEHKPDCLRGLHQLLTGGDVVSAPHVRRVLDTLGIPVTACYGPTESTLFTSCFRMSRPEQVGSAVPIGTPIANTQVYLLDSAFQPVPPGVPGELFIGGDGLARGYLSRPDLTAERFIPNPFSAAPGARLYRTGDRARWRQDGVLEFLGRIDSQVKVRGYRIELAEVEAALLAHSAVREATALVREDVPGDKRLVAYVVHPSGEQAPDSAALRDFLKQRLPEFMVPSAIIALEALPLTANGKVDRKALPAPALSRFEPRSAYVAPRNDVEQRLCDIWAQVLGRKQVGIHDNFFELGGDSIISIQVVARARRAGLVLATRQLFQHQTVAQLALVVKSSSETLVEQGPVSGPVPLTPVQHQLLAHDAAHAHHFNQALMLASRHPLDSALLEKALAHVVAHHDALRLRFRQHEGAWLQDNASPDEAPFHLFQVDLSATPASEQPQALEAEASRLQASFVLSQPPLLRAALFHLGDGQQRLLLVVHHLIVDTVSWRVLVEDLESAYQQLQQRLTVTLPAKSTSFQAWARRLQAHAHSEALLTEAPLWLDEARAKVAPLPTDASGPNTHASERSVSVSLDAAETKLLLQEVPAAWRAHINDVLLTALARALSEWTGQSHVLVDLEGHGRQELFDDVDVSRTVGWFTTFAPVLLPVPSSSSTGECLRAVRDSLRRLPHHGIGFGLLRWLGAPEVSQQLQALAAPQVAFNYLGQLDAAASSSRLFSLSNEPVGPSISPSGSRAHVLEINGSVLDGRLQLSFGYSTHLHHAATIESLAGRFLHHLRDLISLRTSEDARRFSPGDFSLAALSHSSLDTVLRLAGSDVEDIYPLSPTQQGLLFHALLAPSSSAYFEQLAWTVTSSLDLPAFLRAWKVCLQRHTILRSSFHWEGLPSPLQVVHSHVELPFEQLDWSELSASEQHARFEQLLVQDQRRGLDLRRAPLVRLTAIRLADDSVRFLWSHHHLLLDGWSLGLLISEVFSLYESFRSGLTPPPAPRAPFRDYIAWLQRRDASADESFWRAYLEGFTAPTPLPADTHASPPQGQQPTHPTLEVELSPQATAALQAFARQHQLTLNTLALAAWGLVLSHYSGEKDVVFGNTVAGRPPELSGSDTLVGIFINTLPTRVRLPSPSSPLLPWLQSLQAQQVELRQYDHSPLVQVQSFSQVPRGASLFDSLLVFENYPLDASMSGTTSSLRAKDILARDHTNYPLGLSVLPAQSLRLRAVYESPRLEPASVQWLLEHWRNALLSLTSASRLGDVSLLSDAERQQVLVHWNDTRKEFPADTCIHHVFEQQAALRPDAIAVEFGDERLTYRQLDERANQLAWHLRSLGVGPEVRVALCVERSPQLVVSILAVLKAGGAYVPLDPSYPTERLSFMLRDARPPVLLAQEHLADELPVQSELLVLVDSDWDSLIARQPTHAPVVPVHSDSLAYVIYTSGSTGRPKGAMVTHRGVAHYLHWALREYRVSEGQSAPVHTSIAFDATLTSLLTPLLAGGSVHLLPSSNELQALADSLRRHHHGLVKLTPAHLQVLLDLLSPQDLASLAGTFVVGGEALPPSTVERWRRLAPRVRLVNEYGPTETVVGCSIQDLSASGLVNGIVPIGRPISNACLYILDTQLQPVPVGVPGELFIGGVQVGRGYLSRPELTAERFVPDAFSSEPGARLYRTGDKARWLADGTLEYLGRLDFQVKLRGFRIELGEIEAALELHPHVRQAVAVVREDSPGDKRLVAYVVTPSGTQALDSGALRTFLKQKLPEYMVPTAFVALEALPLTSNGKVDRKALPNPDGALASSSEYIAPRDATELRLASIWSEVLKVERVGIHDDFFELGGHSLLATQVLSRIRASFDIELPLPALFEAPTLEALARAVDTASRSARALALPPLKPVSREQPLPLSFAQQRLWFLDQLVPDSPLYNIPAPLRLEGTLDTSALERSLSELVRRHEVLRTSFPSEAGQPLQVIAPPAPLSLEQVDLSALPTAEQEAKAHRLIEAECRKPFSLAQGPLLRALLLKLNEQQHVLVLNLHHIVSDGWSMGVLAREVAALYEAFSQGKPSPLPELPVQYADFATWQRQWLQGEALEAQFSYWRQQLAGAPQVLELPTDRPRPAVQSYRGAMLSRLIPAELAQALQALCQREGVTPFMALLAAFQSLLSRYSGQTDIVVGTDIAGRTHADTEGLIGFFVNQLVMRGDLSGDPSFRELLSRTRQATLGAYAHQDIPFEELVRALNPERSLAHAPIFQVKLVLQNTPPAELHVPGLTFKGTESNTGAAKFDLTLVIDETPAGLACVCDYSTDLFDADTMARMLEHLQVLLEGAVAHPDTRLSSLPLLMETERQQVLVEWNDTRAPLAADSCIHHLFEAQARRTPDAPALGFEGAWLSYRELDERSNQLAHHLRSLGVGPEVRVGLCSERSLELVVGLFAILKAGGAYVPLDPSYPRQRLEWMLEDARPAVLLAQPPLLERLPQSHGARVVSLNDESLSALPTHAPVSLSTPDTLAYVIFTSGSTGRPKGAMNAHRAVCNRLLWMQHAYGLSAQDVVLQKTPYSFDVSVWEFFWPLIVGARLVLARPGGHQEPDYLLRLISEQHVTTTHFVPSMLQHFLEQPGLERCTSLRLVVCSGEALSPELSQRCLQRLPSAQLHNLYGPTEAAVDVTAFHCQPQHGRRSIPIGRPISNTSIRILDAHLRPVPAGVPGELFIGGIQVGRGYLSRPELTAERFIPDAFSSEPGARLYRTGDKARWLADGNIEYLGRLDYQVKVRGLRIELGEIEAALELHPHVRQAVVVAREDSASGDKRLVAYVVPPSGEQAPDTTALRDFLKQKLPEYMVPAAFVSLEALPLNSSGKVDRKALPALDLSRSEPRSAYVAPRNDVEQRLCDIWALVLGRKQVGIHDNFFELGGDSIISLQVVARARRAGLVLATRQLFQHQTVAQLALVAKSSSESVGEQGPIAGPVPLTPAQVQLLRHDAAHAHHFNQAVLLASREPLQPALLEKALAHVVAHHDALRLRFRQDEGAWFQENASPEDAPLHLLQVDLSSTPASEQPAALEAEASRLQASFVLTQPPLLRAALFHLGDGQQRLLLVAHHLVIDGVSWRVLLEDLESAYQQLQRGPHAALPAKTTSFQSWARHLQDYARSESLSSEAALWLDEARAKVAPLPTDASGPNTHASERSVSISLDAEETKLLLQDVPSAWRAHINDVLLTALARALSEWTGQSQVLVHLEGHGREELFDDVDLSRTVGWFTSFAPVLLPVPSSGSAGECLRAVRDSLRSLPHHGIGFGLLKWLGPTDMAQRLQSLPVPQVVFNYLGQLDAAAASSRLFSLSNEPVGPSISPSGLRMHALEINGSVFQGRMQFGFGYSTHLHHAATIESLAGRFLHHLRDLISLRSSEDARRFSPGDFPLAALSPQSLDTVLRQAGSDVEDIYPLSPTQQGLLFHALLAPSSSAYFEQLAWTVTSSLDLPAFLRAWKVCLQRHTILRSSFHWEGLPSPLQVVHSQVELPFEQLDWSELSASEQHARFEQLLVQDQRRGLDLRRAPLVRLTAIRLADDCVRFLWSHHHLLLDGWSLGLLISEVFSLYESFRSGLTPRPAPRAPFRDYIAWLQRRDASADEAFWRTYLEGFTAPTPLPADTHAAPPQGQQPTHPTLEVELSLQATTALQAFARQHQLTLNTLALASWGLVLAQYSGEHDVVFGNTVAGRPPELSGSDTLVGIFINTLPTRVRLPSGSTPLLPWLQSLQSQQLELRQYEHSPLVQVQSFSQVPRGASLFDSLLVFENYPVDASMSGTTSSLRIKDLLANEHTNYPLGLTVLPGQSLRLRAVYESPRFEPASVQWLLEHWRNALLSLTSASRLGDVSLFSEAERRKVLVEWNDTAADLPADNCIHHVFEAQVQRTPDAPALWMGEDFLTYRQLDTRANQLAWHLRSLGVGPEVRVALCVERSPQLVVSILAVLKAGGAYVPLDPSYPTERLSFMLRDARPPVLLAQEHLADELPVQSELLVLVDSDWDSLIARQPTHAPVVPVHSDSLAYVIYTSGSTGRPKGAMVTHRGLAHYLHWALREYRVSEGQSAPVHTSIAFDATLTSLLTPLLAGGSVHLLPSSNELQALADSLRSHRHGLVKLTPAHLQVLLDLLHPQELASLAGTFVVGGEALPPSTVERWRRLAPLVRLVNEYGPTETVVGCSIQDLSASGLVNGIVPIGRPISNACLYILDTQLQPVPVGVPGELFIGGVQVGRGYLSRPELTAERFVPDAFSSEPGARLYRTGDKARWLADGTLEYLGRLDFQVKLRGFRIELGEIEAALELHPHVRQAVAVVREDSPGDKRLVAYVVTPSGVASPTNELREFLKQKLPEYMVPTAFVALEALPLTSNGKVDRKALPAPDGTLAANIEYVAPRDATELRLASIWGEVLRVERVGIHDNFFELGGHSLLATQVLSRIRASFDIELPLPALFEAPTLEALARAVDTASRSARALALPPLKPVSREQPLPLSFAQQRLWFLDQLVPDSPLYNIPAPLRLEGTLDTAALERSLSELVRRHEVLRTSFPSEAGQPLQVIAPPAPLSLQRVDLSALPATEREAETRRLVEAECIKPFSLSRGPLLRALLLKLAGTEHVLVLNLHHIVSDGWSMGVLAREVAALYEAFSQGKPSPLPELPVQYADFAAWQRQWLQGEALEAQFSYWRQQLAGAPQVLELPTDRPRPATQSYRGATQSRLMPKALSQALQALCQREGVTSFMALLAAFQSLLSRYSGQTDIVVGTDIAGRTHADTEGLIGFFVNQLVMRGDLSGDPSFRELVSRTRQATLGAYTHQDIPFEELVRVLNPERNLAHAPIFQVKLVLQNTPDVELRVPGLTFRGTESGTGAAKFDLTLAIQESAEGLACLCDYSTDLFDADTMARMLEHLQVLLEAAVAAPDTRLSALPLLTEAEQRRVLVEWNDTAAAIEDMCAHHLFEAQVRRTPDAPALRMGDTALTYRQLDERANQLAHHLRSLGVGPEVLVGLCLERSHQLVVSILAVLKAGGAWLPLDPSYPTERLSFILRDARPPVLLTQETLADELPVQSELLVLVDSDWDSLIARQPTHAPIVPVLPDNLAYVIYTSGSTGRPKGTLLRHRGLCNTARQTIDAMRLRPGSRVLQFASIGFDASVWEMIPTLMAGAELHLASRDELMPGAPLHQLLQQRAITAATLTPSVLAQLDPQGLDALETLTSAGEACTAELVARWKPGRRFINAYGPTETTICATLDAEADAKRITIGRPFHNVSAYVLDAHLRPLPVGVPGELFIGGIGLARGYLGRPELTAERFVPNPFAATPGARLYRTGDKARWLSDGTLEYLGRIDFQVKLRGFRIELGEIEAVLSSHPSVREAVVALREDRLVAYFVAQSDHSLDAGSLRSFIQQRLPEYMVPSAFVSLDTLPLNSSGKVDRKALPAPDGALTTSVEFVAPRSETEQRLAALWSEVLKVERVGIHDNFFTLGGHSLLATQVGSRLRASFGVDLPISALFEAPTLEALAAAVDSVSRKERGPELPPLLPVDRAGALPLSFAQQRLWFLDQLIPDSPLYNMPAPLRLEGTLDTSALERSLSELVRRHEVLRTSFPSEAGQPLQVIAPPAPLPLEYVDLSALPTAEREAEARRLVEVECRKPFSLARGPLLRALLLKLADTEHVLVLNLHHIISDGWSMGVLVREVAALYAAFSQGQPSPLPELTVQYADFAAWQRQWLQGEALEAQFTYWRQQLAGAPQVLELPTDRPRPAVQSYRGATFSRLMPAKLAQALQSLCQREGVTSFMALLAAFQSLLSRYSGLTDIVVGTDIAGRTHADTEGLIGFFVNQLALRGDLSGDPSFRALLSRTRQATLGAYAHQDIPFEELVRVLNPERSLAHAPVFQVKLALQNTPDAELKLPGLALRGVDGNTGAAKFDLTLTFSETPEGLACLCDYSTDLYDADTMARLLEHFQVLLEAAVAWPDTRLSELPLLTEAERQQVLVKWNDTRAPLAVDSCIHHLFEAQARRTPDAPALGFEGEWLSYRELDERSNQLAHHLRSLGVGPEVRVGLCAERSLELVVGLFAILKAGGAYVPLDPSYPRQRLEWMLEDARPAVLLAQPSLLTLLPESPGARVLSLGDESPRGLPTHPPASLSTPDTLAYVIFTSGSTGRPKGVQVPHRTVSNFFSGMDACILLPERRVWLAVTRFSFDISVLEMLWTLARGFRVVLPSDTLTPAWLSQAVRQHSVTHLQCTPSLARALLLDADSADALSSLQQMLVGGEALSAELARELRLRVPSLLNMYGPTETTVWSSSFPVPAAASAFVPLGHPISNTALYVLDAHLQPLPLGVPGELFIGGAGVVRGYLSRPELTAERFIPDAFSTEPGARLYRTGDKVRRRADGSLEFLGRLDFQVKVRGFRIELGEIEAALELHPHVRQAVVVAREDSPGDKRLVAYVVPPSGEQAPDSSALRDFLKHKLPDYMVPAAFVALEALPLTFNGKVDRKALPALTLAERRGKKAYTPPGTPTEELLTRLWAQVLGLEQVGIHDNFFELGGNSLLGVSLVAMAAQAGLALQVMQLFQHQTVAELAPAVGIASPPSRRDTGAQAPRVDEQLPLLPQFQWLVETFDMETQVWATTQVWDVPPQIRAELLRATLEHLGEHHDVLRLRLRRAPEGWTARMLASAGEPHVEEHDLTGLVPQAQREAMLDIGRRLQSDLTITRGPVLALALCRLGGPGPDKLILSIHHCVYDAFSMPLLLSDLYGAYQRLATGQPPQPPPASATYREYILAVGAHRRSSEAMREARAYWLDEARLRPGSPMPVDLGNGPHTDLNSRRLSLPIPPELVGRLVDYIRLHTDVSLNDLLLFGLARAWARWTGDLPLRLDVEHNGRAGVVPGVDLSRMIGPTTIKFPMRFEQKSAEPPQVAFASAKRTVRETTAQALGYGLLRYGPDEAVRQRLASSGSPQVFFNNRGATLVQPQRQDQVPGSAEVFAFPRTDGKASIVSYDLMIECDGAGAEMRVSWVYSGAIHREETIRALAEDLYAQLAALVDAG